MNAFEGVSIQMTLLMFYEGCRNKEYIFWGIRRNSGAGTVEFPRQDPMTRRTWAVTVRKAENLEAGSTRSDRLAHGLPSLPGTLVTGIRLLCAFPPARPS